jgi:hypothetical protein
MNARSLYRVLLRQRVLPDARCTKSRTPPNDVNRDVDKQHDGRKTVPLLKDKRSRNRQERFVAEHQVDGARNHDVEREKPQN